MSRKLSEFLFLLAVAIAVAVVPIACGSSNNPGDGSPGDAVTSMTHG